MKDYEVPEKFEATKEEEEEEKEEDDASIQVA
jgi:hypothetical protein